MSSTPRREKSVVLVLCGSNRLNSFADVKTIRSPIYSSARLWLIVVYLWVVVGGRGMWRPWSWTWPRPFLD